MMQDILRNSVRRLVGLLRVCDRVLDQKVRQCMKYQSPFMAGLPCFMLVTPATRLANSYLLYDIDYFFVYRLVTLNHNNLDISPNR
jgi:hypothetical protein